MTPGWPGSIPIGTPEPLAGLPYKPRTHATEHPVIVTTTSSIEGKSITRYCGIVTGEAVLGANLFKDLFAGIRDLVGGRSATGTAVMVE